MWTFRIPERLAGGMVEGWSTRVSEVLEGRSDVVEIEDSWESEEVQVWDPRESGMIKISDAIRRFKDASCPLRVLLLELVKPRHISTHSLVVIRAGFALLTLSPLSEKYSPRLSFSTSASALRFITAHA